MLFMYACLLAFKMKSAATVNCGQGGRAARKARPNYLFIRQKPRKSSRNLAQFFFIQTRIRILWQLTEKEMDRSKH